MRSVVDQNFVMRRMTIHSRPRTSGKLCRLILIGNNIFVLSWSWKQQFSPKCCRISNNGGRNIDTTPHYQLKINWISNFESSKCNTEHTLILLQIKWKKKKNLTHLQLYKIAPDVTSIFNIDVGWVRNPSASFKSKHRNEVGRYIEWMLTNDGM